MSLEESSVARLEVLIQRLLDAEFLVDSHGTALMEEASAARRLCQMGAEPEAVEHVQRILLFIDALVKTKALQPADVHEVIGCARTILSDISSESTR